MFRGSFGETYQGELNGTALSLQNEIESSNATFLEELKLLNDRFDKLEADIDITRNTESLLSRLVDRKRQCWAKYPLLKKGNP